MAVSENKTHRQMHPDHHEVFTPENSPLSMLSVVRLRLRKDEGSWTGWTHDCEVALHLLVGQCTIKIAGPWGTPIYRNFGERRDVFSGLSTTLILGPGTEYCILASTRYVDFVVAGAPLLGGQQVEKMPVLVSPADVVVHTIGEGHTTRLVREVVGQESPAVRLRIGETLNPTGCWSSWPHHNFDATPIIAKDFEEVFLYFTKPRTGWGFQKRCGLFSTLEEIDDVITVKNGDAAIVPLGEHPVVAGVDSQLLYVWFYVSPISKVYAKWAEDIGGYA